jgi:methoxymalonate biosynthesis protein
MTVKCVVWDLDGTVWPGIAIEGPAGTLPEPFPRALAAIDALEERGIVSSVASRTDPSQEATLAADPRLGTRFVAPQLGWGDKHEAIRRIAETLGIATSDMVFVDDNPFERAEVAALLPEVRVFDPDELYTALEAPGDLMPEAVTDEARRRAARYREVQARRAAEQDFAGTREEFLRSCDMVLTIGQARPDDLPRVAELAERTHRFNTTGEQWSLAQIERIAGDPGWSLPVARLTDRFGDYGIISTALIEHVPADEAWRLRLFMVSCRAAGREVPMAALGWIMRRARAGGAGRVLVDVRTDLANLELRVLLRRAGFTAAQPLAGDGPVLLGRDLSGELPAVPHIRIVE